MQWRIIAKFNEILVTNIVRHKCIVYFFSVVGVGPKAVTSKNSEIIFFC